MPGTAPSTAPQHRTDVLVVGAGPTGLLVAGDLAAAGHDVTLVERRPPGRDNLTRALAVHARTLEVLDARGLADELVATGNTIDRLGFFGHAVLDPTRLPSRFPYVLITGQYQVERLLERRAREAGVTFRHATELTAVRQDADGVEADVRPVGAGVEGGAGPLRVRAAYLVGTDGLHSTVRTALGLPFPGRSAIRSMVLADVRLADPPGTPFLANADGTAFGLVGSFGDGWYRVMGWHRDRRLPDSAPADLAEVRACVRQALGSDFGMHDARWISRFHSDERQAPHYRVGRAFLAGDAAHVHSPAGGMGMNTGLQDAANLSWKLSRVLRGLAAPALLDSYEAERHPVGRLVLRLSGALLRAALLRAAPLRALRGAAAEAVTRVPALTDRALLRVSGIGLSYPAPRGAHPLTGRRAPDLPLTTGRLYEALRAGTFVLVGPAGTAPPAPPAPPAPSGPVSGAAGAPPYLAAVAARDTRRTVLVRPDGHVAWAADRPDPAGLRRALRAWTGAAPAEAGPGLP